MKQSYSVYLFMLLISTSATASEEKRPKYPPLPLNLSQQPLQPLPSPSSSEEFVSPRPPQEPRQHSILEEIEQSCNAEILSAQKLKTAKLERERRLRNLRAQRVKQFLRVAQDNNNQSNSSGLWIPTAAATTAAGVTSTIAYLAKNSQQVPMRGMGDLALDGATGGLSTGVQAAIYGGIALVTVGTGTAIVVSVKRAFSKMWNSIQKARGDNALAERHSKETITDLQEQINDLSTFASTGRKQHAENMLRLIKENKKMSETQHRTLEELASLQNSNDAISEGIELLTSSAQKREALDQQRKTHDGQVAAELKRLWAALGNKKDKK